MTFLQPTVFWALPLILLPILIHFLNRMRHRPQAWAAMRFLVSATRSSVNNARLRQWLVLLLRVLAVGALILFLSRPLAGGWLGWALSPAPDAVLILLDRSASMEAVMEGGAVSKRQQAIRVLSQAAKSFEETSRLVLIENVFRSPQEIKRAASLNDATLSGATDTGADIPGLLTSALNWIVDNRAGTVEIWIASDLQRSNWQPDDSRWESLMAQYQALPQKVHLRLLALDQPGQANRSISLKEVLRRARGRQGELQFAADLQASAPSSEMIPLSITLDGAQMQREVNLEGQSLRWRNKLVLSEQAGTGWGSFQLPVDGNTQDNVAFFVYGPEAVLRATIVSSEPRHARLLQFAIGASGKKTTPAAVVLPPEGLDRAVWEDNTFLVWRENLPVGANAQRIRAFAEQGGVVLCFPPGRADAARLEGLGWGNIESTETEKPFRILRWNQEEGPLAKSDEGLSLPLSQAAFLQRQPISGGKVVLAAFEDGTPFLVRQSVGRGEIYFCATLPEREWSSLGDGPVLVPMMQRLLEAGSRRLHQTVAVNCGELSAVDQALRWESLDSPGLKDIRSRAGVYRSGERLLAVNRPPVEDDPEIVEASEARRLFGLVGVQMLQERRSDRENLQGEIWRVFLCGMLLFLVAEAALILPPARKGSLAAKTGGARTAPGAMEGVR